ncbi:hypothetical protein [Bradyrhizobium sp. USDA 329]|uniref:hypothetical protein n=1 Tax=unclassified Bradyrhizobium TaxID=2631580 RepID=UPI003513BEAC
MVKKSQPEYYIQLCAQRYAQITENIVVSSSAAEISEMKHKLTIIKEAALEEAKAERRYRMLSLPEYLKVIVDRGGALEQSIPRADALCLIDYFAVPPPGTLGLLSSSQLDNLADQCEGWACTPNLRDYEAARLNGKAIGFRLLAEYLGPLHRPYEPPKSLHGLLSGTPD